MSILISLAEWEQNLLGEEQKSILFVIFIAERRWKGFYFILWFDEKENQMIPLLLGTHTCWCL